MTSGQQILATLIGTVAGFVFAIVLFYLTEHIKNKRAKDNILKSLKREFEYNVNLLGTIIEDIKKTITKISYDDTEVFFYFRYSWFQRIFLQEAFRLGILFEKLTDEEIGALDTMLRRFDYIGEGIINDKIKAWKEGKIEKKKILNNMEFERDDLEKYIKQLQSMKDRLCKK